MLPVTSLSSIRPAIQENGWHWLAILNMNHFIDTPGLAELTGTPGLHITDSNTDTSADFMKTGKDSGFTYEEGPVKGYLLVEINVDKIPDLTP